jgi:hypothetical protein
MSQISSKGTGGGGGGGVNTLTGNIGVATAVANNINVVGGSNISTTGVGDTLTLDVSGTTDHAVQVGSVAGSLSSLALGTSGQVLTSNGAGMDPSFQTVSGGGITSVTGDSGGAQTGPAITLTGGTSGGLFAGAANTLTLAFSELNLPTSTSSSTGVINLGGSKFLHNYGALADKNVFVGQDSGNFTLTSGTATGNVGLGAQSLNSIVTSQFNLGIGFNAAFALNSGNQNVMIGNYGGFQATSASNNSIIGFQSAINLLTGSFNVIIGVDQPSGANAYTGAESSNIIIMNSGVVGESNTMRLGTSGAGNKQVNRCFVAGVFGATVGVSGVPVVVDNADQFGTVVSSERYKENIEDMDDYSDDIHELRPVIFNYKQELNAEHKSVGLIAEEVELQMPQLVVKDKEGLPMTVRYLDLIPMLLNEVQKLRKELNALKS